MLIISKLFERKLVLNYWFKRSPLFIYFCTENQIHHLTIARQHCATELCPKQSLLFIHFKDYICFNLMKIFDCHIWDTEKSII